MDKFEEVLPKLVKIQLFSDFNIDDENDCRILQAVYDSMTIENYQKGDVIIEEGKIGDDFYILYSGKVHISRKTPAGDEIALADLSSEMNIFFGETALISDDPRTATVRALPTAAALPFHLQSSLQFAIRSLFWAIGCF